MKVGVRVRIRIRVRIRVRVKVRVRTSVNNTVLTLLEVSEADPLFNMLTSVVGACAHDNVSRAVYTTPEAFKAH